MLLAMVVPHPSQECLVLGHGIEVLVVDVGLGDETAGLVHTILAPLFLDVFEPSIYEVSPDVFGC
jgi:hypothetical protein